MTDSTPARAPTPSYSNSSTQHDERFSESQESYVTSASNATHPSVPGLAQSASSVSQLSTSGSPSFELDRSASPATASAMRHSLMTTGALDVEKASFHLPIGHRPTTPPDFLSGTRHRPWQGDGISPSSSSASSSPPTRGTKRTANGAAKLQSPMSVITPVGLESAHRNPASTPRQQYVREQATKLQMRLQLAMTKVKHGWENMSMDEIDEMHSTLTSPMSASARTPTFPSYVYPSPRLMANPQRHSRNLSSITATTSRPMTSYSRQSQPHHNHHHSRSHSALSGHTRYASAPDRPSLAPALDLASVKSARTGAMQNRMTTPTPQEQDALDSLMLMGSPAGHFVRR